MDGEESWEIGSRYVRQTVLFDANNDIAARHTSERLMLERIAGVWPDVAGLFFAKLPRASAPKYAICG